MIETLSAQRRHVEPDGGSLYGLALIGGDLWVAHEHGITVLGLEADGATLGHLWLDGPVRYVFPTLDGRGVTWVGEGGFGVARFVERH